MVVEANQGNRWVEIGRTAPAKSQTILTPQVVRLPVRPFDQVRVRIANRSEQVAMMVDALTFLELGL